jgi:hypothetical protein
MKKPKDHVTMTAYVDPKTHAEFAIKCMQHGIKRQWAITELIRAYAAGDIHVVKLEQSRLGNDIPSL